MADKNFTKADFEQSLINLGVKLAEDAIKGNTTDKFKTAETAVNIYNALKERNITEKLKRG